MQSWGGAQLASPHSLGPAPLRPVHPNHITRSRAHDTAQGKGPSVASSNWSSSNALGTRVTKAQDLHHLTGRPRDQECLVPKWYLLRKP